MSGRYFWPEPHPGTEDYQVCNTHLVHHKSGEVLKANLWSNGQWSGFGQYHTTETLKNIGYLGVRRPFEEAYERERFEKWWKSFWQFSDPVCFRRDDEEYFSIETEHAWQGWLAAMRAERGVE